jgi:hypothetical protein
MKDSRGSVGTGDRDGVLDESTRVMPRQRCRGTILLVAQGQVDESRRTHQPRRCPGKRLQVHRHLLQLNANPPAARMPDARSVRSRSRPGCCSVNPSCSREVVSYRRGEDHLAVFRLLVVAPEEIGDRPDEGGEIGVGHGRAPRGKWSRNGAIEGCAGKSARRPARAGAPPLPKGLEYPPS